jgi:hypothetical protein
MTIRKYLSKDAAKAAEPKIRVELEARMKEWGAHGWAFVGAPDRLRLEVRVPYTLADPENPVTPIALPSSIGGGLLKPKVSASLYRGGPTMPPAALMAPFGAPGGSVDAPLAPGSPIVVGVNGSQHAGIACVLAIGGEPHLLTCGHVFPPQSAGTPVFAAGRRVALLTQNLLDTSPQMDAAWCRLTREGARLLRASGDAPTWLRRAVAPAAEQAGKTAIFWPSAEGAGASISTKIEAPSSFQGDLQDPRDWVLALPDFIQTQGVTNGGDSGSVLVLEQNYYGLCTGRVGRSSFFTSISLAIARIKKTNTGEVSIWTFDT